MYLLMFFLLILTFEKILGKSDEYYNCINPNKDVDSPSVCTSIQIPESEGYKCCSMKIEYKGEQEYSCFALENEYTKSKKKLDEYIANISLASVFGINGGQIEIECNQDMITSQNYEKFNDEFLNCYKGHLKGVENENECKNNNIPEKEVSKCCYVETSQIINGTVIKDKRCYILENQYFSKDKNFTNYLLDQSQAENLEQIRDVNVTISCKNYETFYFIGKSGDALPVESSIDIISNNKIQNTDIVIPSTEGIGKNANQNDSLSSTETETNTDTQTDSLFSTETVTNSDTQTEAHTQTDIQTQT